MRSRLPAARPQTSPRSRASSIEFLDGPAPGLRLHPRAGDDPTAPPAWFTSIAVRADEEKRIPPQRDQGPRNSLSLARRSCGSSGLLMRYSYSPSRSGKCIVTT
jgi:hypothetical protein